MHTDTWSQVDQPLAALEVRQAARRVAEEARAELTYDAVPFGGSGPPKSFWEKKHKAALAAGGLSLHERATLEAAEISGFPAPEEREELEQREFPFLKKLLVETYNAYRAAWTTQGNQESPQFLNDLCQQVFKPLALALLEDGQVNLPELSGVAHIAALLERLPLRRRCNLAEFVVKDLRERIRLDARRLQHQQARKAAEESPRSESPKKDKPTGFEGLPELPDSEIDLWLDNAELTGPQRECAELAWKYKCGLSEISSRRKKGKDRKTIYEHLCRARVKIDKAVRKLGMTKLAPMTKSPNSGDASDYPMN